MEELSFKLESFEGPLDLLLKLIAKNKVSITDIPISLIFEQYIEYLDNMRRMDMEIAGEFVTMAAELMLIKSRVLLPKSEDADEEDPRAKLAAALIEYKRAKEEAAYLARRYEEFADRIVKDTDEIAPDTSYIAPQEVSALTKAFRRIMRSKLADEKRGDEKAEGHERFRSFEAQLKRRIVTVQERVIWTIRMLLRGDMDFDSLMSVCGSRNELIATFLALLDLVKAGRVLLTFADEDIILTLCREHDRTNRSSERLDYFD